MMNDCRKFKHSMEELFKKQRTPRIEKFEENRPLMNVGAINSFGTSRDKLIIIADV